MLFFVLAGITVLVSLAAAIADAIGKKENKSGSFSVFMGFFITVGGILFVVTMVISAISHSYPGDKQELVNSETYTIAENTKLDTSEEGYLKFIAVRPDTYLEPHTISYSELQIDSLDSKQILVEKVDHSHTWLYPWVFTNKTKVILK